MDFVEGWLCISRLFVVQTIYMMSIMSKQSLDKMNGDAYSFYTLWTGTCLLLWGMPPEEVEIPEWQRELLVLRASPLLPAGFPAGS